MSDGSIIHALRNAAARAVTSHDELLTIWRNLDSSQIAGECTPDDVQLLQELVRRRIYPINAFELLARADREAAIDTLLSRYVGVHVDPDRKFGGYSFELESMIEDLVNVHGDAALRELIARPQFEAARLRDHRVQAALCQALEIDEPALRAWLEQT